MSNALFGGWVFKAVVGTVVGMSVLSPAVYAHHSMAMFDAAKTVTIEGSVKTFRWVSPHPLMELTVPYKAGPIDWTIEVSSLSTLLRAGWTPTTVKFGDRVKVICHPLRNGDAGCNFQSLTFPDGKVMGLGANN
jgi:hypothetical protein